MNAARHDKIKEFNSYYAIEYEKEMAKKAKRKKGVIRRMTFFSLFIAVLLGLAAMTIHSQREALTAKLDKSEQLQAELAALQLAERDLNIEIDNLNNLDYISDIVRRDYYFTKPGEILFKVMPADTD